MIMKIIKHLVNELTKVSDSEKSSSKESSENLFSEDFVIKIPNDGKPNSKPLKSYTNDKISLKKELDPAIIHLQKIKDWRYKLSDKFVLDNFYIDTKKYESVQEYYDSLDKSDKKKNEKYYNALKIKFNDRITKTINIYSRCTVIDFLTCTCI